MSKSISVVLTATTLLTVAAPFVASADDSLSGGTQPEFTQVTQVNGTIVDVAVGNPSFSTLVAALETSSLVETLQGAGPFTVFAPTNEAFEKIPASVLSSMLENVDTLTQVLLYHVTDGVQDIRYQFSPHDIATAQGQNVYAERSECDPAAQAPSGEQSEACSAGYELRINNSKVQGRVIRADNGVIYVIDSVLLPQFR